MSFPITFKACVVNEPKAKYTILDRSLNAPGDNEVVIKITATAVNPVDWKMRNCDAFITEYPAVLGSDAAGIIYRQ
ncbi:hypothetical protein CFAM422_013373 [Trichoderma lentiforme]|uniref:Alcohol dehydrogenase-like N-terminal domain-containing protein n=1 Tax=Trichoderma lentiforme TaxID=1567552 RepID=A0A9P4X0U3_9HYPO|nr:hypothetical protein CFAM422_013373 [Trichoderma lentiforme]